MVRSKYCSLQINRDYNRKECEYDPGGYFIVNGSEKYVLSLEKMVENKPLVFTKKDAGVERDKLIKKALKKSEEIVKKQEESAKEEIKKINSDTKREISLLNEIAERNIQKAVDVIIEEISKGE